jgi:hypothetical protein
MQYTPGQVKTAVGVTEETFRYWRKVFDPIKGRRGYKPCFSFGEMLALSVVRVFIRSFDVATATVAEIAPSLFDLCKGETWLSRESWFLVFDPEVKSLTRLPDAALAKLRGPVMVVPCRPLADALKLKFTADPELSRQMPLPLAPAVVKTRRKSARRA